MSITMSNPNSISTRHLLGILVANWLSEVDLLGILVANWLPEVANWLPQAQDDPPLEYSRCKLAATGAQYTT